MRRYKTILPVLHDGQPYAPDDPIDLDEVAAAALLGCGAIQATGETDAAAKPAAKGKTKPEAMA